MAWSVFRRVRGVTLELRHRAGDHAPGKALTIITEGFLEKMKCDGSRAPTLGTIQPHPPTGLGTPGRAIAVLRILHVVAAATCVLLTGCARELSSASYTGFQRGYSPVASAVFRRPEAPQDRVGSARQDILIVSAAEGGAAPAIAAGREWILQGDRRDRLGVPVEVVSTCRSSIVDAGRPHGIVWVDAASSGRLRISRTGAVSAPIEARVAYEHAGRVQTRHSRLICRLSPAGTVIALR